MPALGTQAQSLQVQRVGALNTGMQVSWKVSRLTSAFGHILTACEDVTILLPSRNCETTLSRWVVDMSPRFEVDLVGKIVLFHLSSW